MNNEKFILRKIVQNQNSEVLYMDLFQKIDDDKYSQVASFDPFYSEKKWIYKNESSVYTLKQIRFYCSSGSDLENYKKVKFKGKNIKLISKTETCVVPILNLKELIKDYPEFINLI